MDTYIQEIHFLSVKIRLIRLRAIGEMSSTFISTNATFTGQVENGRQSTHKYWIHSGACRRKQFPRLKLLLHPLKRAKCAY